MSSHKKEPSHFHELIIKSETWFNGAKFFLFVAIFVAGILFFTEYFTHHLLLDRDAKWINLETTLNLLAEFIDKFKLQELLYHLLAVCLELALVLFVIEKLLRDFERQQETSKRKKQLRLIKSAMFRVELQDLYIACFQALNDDQISLSAIQGAERATLRKWKNIIAKRTKEEWESLWDEHVIKNRVLRAYADAKPSWKRFEDFALRYNLDDVFYDMIAIQHLVADYIACDSVRSKGQEIFNAQVEAYFSRHRHQILNVWSNGIKKFIDYAVDLKGSAAEINGMKEDEFFTEMMKEYMDKVDWNEEIEKNSKAKQNASTVTVQGFPEILSPPY